MTNSSNVSAQIVRLLLACCGLAVLWYGAALMSVAGLSLMLLGLTVAVTAATAPGGLVPRVHLAPVRIVVQRRLR